MDFVSHAERLLKRRGLNHFGWSRLERPLSIDVYRDWLAQGCHADMDYLKLHADAKADPRQLAPRARTALVVAKGYAPHPYAPKTRPLRYLRTALYAQGDDYHREFKAELEQIALELKLDFPSEEFLCFTDSAPILERDLAHRAGLGWIGKNTCLLHTQHGSLFFLGQILMSPELNVERSLVPDACGTCTRCLDVCPTGALERPRWLDARKCISYWNIESRQSPPIELREKFADWFFGCDLCQTVCPWNEKSHGRDWMRNLSQTRTTDSNEELIADLRFVLKSGHRELARHIGKLPLLRARPIGLKRNALIIVGNLRLNILKPEVEFCQSKPQLKEIAGWTLTQLI